MDRLALTIEEPPVKDDDIPLPPVRGGDRELPPDEHRRPVPPFAAPAERVRPDGEPEEPEGHAYFAWGDDDGVEDPTVAVELGSSDGFPMDAFIIPEEAERLPAPGRVRVSRSVTDDLARRLAEFAELLRADGAEAITRALDEADDFEFRLGAFLSDYLDGQSG